VVKSVQPVIQRLSICKVFGESNSKSWTTERIEKENILRMKFFGLSTKLLAKLTCRCSKYHPGCTRRSEQLLEVANHRRMIHFGSLLTFLFFVFPFRGSGLRENYFWLQPRLFSHQLIRTTTLCCGWDGKCFSLNWHNQGVLQWYIVLSRSYRSLVRTLAMTNCFCNISWPIVGCKQFRDHYSRRSLQQNINRTDYQNINKINSEWWYAWFNLKQIKPNSHNKMESHRTHHHKVHTTK
jgi:hypothetical protein